MDELEEDEHYCTDFEWFSPLFSDDHDEEELCCTECGRVKWTARQVQGGEFNA